MSSPISQPPLYGLLQENPSQMISHLEGAGLTPFDAKKVCDFVQKSIPLLQGFFQQYCAATISRKHSTLPVTLVCTPTEVYVHLKGVKGSYLKGAIKTAKEAISLFTGTHLKRLVAHPNLSNADHFSVENSIHLEYTMLHELKGLRGVATLFDGIETINSKGIPTFNLYEKNYHLGDLFEKYAELPIKNKLEIAEDLICGLYHIHSHDIAHRDLKLDNVFLEKLEGGSVAAVIGDFNLAIKSNPSTPVKTLTGTLDYLAPEKLYHIRHSLPWHSHDEIVADVWSLGLILDLLLFRIRGAPAAIAYTWSTLNDRSKLTHLIGLGNTQKIEELQESFFSKPEDHFPLDCLIYGMLRLDPRERLTSEQVLTLWPQVKAECVLVISALESPD